ncbi:MAG TPA: ergothioneine biosynthesis protein EgtB [Acidimicrobiales bacterium]|nr:ergothioneine biosynthesis protein EgtB [Acidimicrobiales bacterium]
MTPTDDPHRAYREVRDLTERLAAPLSPEDQTVQSMPDVSPTKWHRAHTTWFFETFLLEPHAPGYVGFDPHSGFLFNSYYETVGARFPRPQRGLVSRPGVHEIAQYRHHVDKEMGELLAGALPGPVHDLVELGLHHEQQHQELLLMDIKHVLSVNPLWPAYAAAAPASEGVLDAPPARPSWVAHEGGVVEIGHAGPGFSFDNETPRHGALVEPFEIASGLVTCAEWLAFVDDGGYTRPDLWMSDGWATVQAQRWEAPLYWHHEDDGWWVFGLHGLEPVDPAQPVSHVSWYEADAFARWAGARLPWEAEWESAAPPAPPAAPLDLGALHPRPAGASADPGQWYGEVWQWTASPYTAYPGFRPAAGAVGEYNGKFMVNQQTLRGSACVTPPGHARRTYRNFFPPHARWAFAGLRLARDAG